MVVPIYRASSDIFSLHTHRRRGILPRISDETPNYNVSSFNCVSPMKLRKISRSKKIGKLAKLPIEILQLPTYAAWTNPIEKLWRWGRQSVIHLHRLSNDWQALQDKALAFMQQFKGGSQQLLHYVGLLPK